MKQSFLQYVAADILEKYSGRLHRVAIVFPNKRASLFLNQYLYQMVGHTMLGPNYFTISDLFVKHSGLILADQIQLVCQLYHCYTSQIKTSESLDQFFPWGQVLLADFDDIDKNMADAEMVFRNLRDWHEYDDVTHLDDEEKKMLKLFFSNFSDDHNDKLKERFLEVWSKLGDVYHAYQRQLRKKGIAYEGMILRQVAEDEHLSFDYDDYLFIGFNALHTAEHRLFKRLKEEQKAHFYWDFDDYYMPTKEDSGLRYKPGRFIAEYMSVFPNELDNHNADIYRQYQLPKGITFVSCSTNYLQVQYVSQWLTRKGNQQIDQETAIVLCDENLLPTIIHHIPDSVSDVNITSGYPLQLSQVASFVQQLIALRMEGNPRGGDTFRMTFVNTVIRHPYMRYLCEHQEEVIRFFKNYRLYIKRADMADLEEGVQALFEEFAPSQNVDYQPSVAMAEYLRKILKKAGIGANQKGSPHNLPLEQEAIYRTYTIINRLYGLMMSDELRIDLNTFIRLLNQLIHSTSVPFHGEPAVGLQIMGILETRNIDFRHLLILSCNEGMMPKGEQPPSFIPYILRKAYGLTTSEHQTSLYAYYFFRLLQRAEDVTILYCNANDEGQKGEMSRFMLQMLVEDPYHPIIRRETLHTHAKTSNQGPKPIIKDKHVMDKLHHISSFSPTAIGKYLRCPVSFFYYLIANLKEKDDDAIDDIDNRLFGIIFHESARKMYADFPKFVQESDIQSLYEDKKKIGKYVDSVFQEQLFNNKPRDLGEYNGLQLINRDVIIHYLQQLLKADLQMTPFRIIDKECSVCDNMDVDGLQVKYGGIIDRLDEISTKDGKLVRVVDYKTGSSEPGKIQSIGDIFNPENIDKHSDYLLQTFLYATIVHHKSYKLDCSVPVSPALFYIQHSVKDNYNPILMMNKELVTDVSRYSGDFNNHLKELFRELFNPSQQFEPTPYKNRCENCPYHKLCY